MPSVDSAINGLLAAREAQTHAQVQFAVAAKGLQVHKQLGQAAVDLIDAAANLSKALGRGTNFDAVA